MGSLPQLLPALISPSQTGRSSPHLGQSAAKTLITHSVLSEKGPFLPCLVEMSAAGPTAGSPGIQRSAERGRNICSLSAHTDLLRGLGKAVPSLCCHKDRGTAHSVWWWRAGGRRSTESRQMATQPARLLPE